MGQDIDPLIDAAPPMPFNARWIGPGVKRSWARSAPSDGDRSQSVPIRQSAPRRLPVPAGLTAAPPLKNTVQRPQTGSPAPCPVASHATQTKVPKGWGWGHCSRHRIQEVTHKVTPHEGPAEMATSRSLPPQDHLVPDHVRTNRPSAPSCRTGITRSPASGQARCRQRAVFPSRKTYPSTYVCNFRGFHVANCNSRQTKCDWRKDELPPTSILAHLWIATQTFISRPRSNELSLKLFRKA